jgi:hypothetical protein
MNSIDGGPAFPEHDTFGTNIPGMSLRDYFAGQALMGLLAADTGGSWDKNRCAEAAYFLAEAMLTVRKQGAA